MKKEDFKSLSQDELIAKEKTLKEELFKLCNQRYTGRVEKPHMFSSIKKDIARIETLLRQKDLTKKVEK